MPVSRTELLARALFVHYQPRLRQVHGLRPDWLKNSKTGCNLEIDIYFPEIKVGIEILGVQHGRPVNGTQKDSAAFEKQQRHDMAKIERAKVHGVTLYQLTSFDLNKRRFAPWYTQFCLTHGLKSDCYLDAPYHLFAEAERLSRIKVIKRARRKPGVWPLIQRLLS